MYNDYTSHLIIIRGMKKIFRQKGESSIQQDKQIKKTGE